MTARLRGPVLVVLLVCLIGLLLAVLVPRQLAGDPLDPHDPSPGGARAVVSVLQDAGVRVVEVRRSTALAGLADAASDGAEPGATVLVQGTELLGREQLRRLTGSGAARLVLLEPDGELLRRVLPGVEALEQPVGDAGPVPPSCTAPDPVAAGPAEAAGRLYRLTPAARGVQLCYPVPLEGPGVEGGGPAGSYLRGRTAAGTEVVVLGHPELLANDTVAREGNAALVLRTLGASPTLLWYRPDPLEPTGEEQVSPTDLLPPWVGWVGLQLVLAVLAAVVWRARRFGPLVGEPLPVVVRATETQEGRARLYRQGRARDRAAAALRAASLDRLSATLGAGSGGTAQHLVTVVAERTGRPHPLVHATLLGPVPQDDRALVQLADDLDALEHAVSGRPAEGAMNGGRRRPGAGPPSTTMEADSIEPGTTTRRTAQ